jgi:hypothetical protein
MAIAVGLFGPETPNSGSRHRRLVITWCSLNVPAAGTYDLSAVMTKARDYGIVSLMVDGSQLGPPFNGYNYPNVTVATVDYGSVPLSAGAHKLTFTLVGKNPNSINYFVGIDYLLLTKTN